MREAVESPTSRHQVQSRDQYEVDEVLVESFPASDAPAWTATHAGMPKTKRAKAPDPRESKQRIRDDFERVLALLGESRDGRIDARARAKIVADMIARECLVVDLPVTRMPLEVDRTRFNVEAILHGEANDEIVVGTPYDVLASNPSEINSVPIAILVTVARALARLESEARSQSETRTRGRRVRFVAFANEGNETIGTSAYGDWLRTQGIGLRGALCLGPLSYSPSWPNGSVALLGNMGSRGFAHDLALSIEAALEARAPRVRTLVLPAAVPLARHGDHRTFWENGFCSALLTDTGRPEWLLRGSLAGARRGVDRDTVSDLVIGLVAGLDRLRAM